MAQQKLSPQQVRIIGGKWKGRKLRFHGSSQLRPTLGRTRETLFNWIRPELNGARCLDAFAGSGALGFEALSQGAAQAVFVEQNPRTARTLQDCVHELNARNQATVIKVDVLRYLRSLDEGFDIVFLDPPFSQPQLLPACLTLLAERQLVRRYIYAEAASQSTFEDLCKDTPWQIHKHTKTGDTVAALLISEI